MAAAGRPSRYNPDTTPELARWMARSGLTDEGMAEEFNVTRQTIANWKRKHKEFAEAVAEGKELADARVEDSLYRRAMGFEYEETKIVATSDGSTRRVEKTKKFVVPDTTAQIFWLKNRQKDRWRDSKEITGEGGGPITLKVVYDGDGDS